MSKSGNYDYYWENINEILYGRSGKHIVDRDTFDVYYNSYMSLSDKEMNSKQKKFRTGCFELYADTHDKVLRQRIFKKAGGKDLVRDKRRTAKTIVTTRQEYYEHGASKVDLKGYDTKVKKHEKKMNQKKTMKIPSYSKRKFVRSEKTYVKVKGKKQVRYRNSKGTFSSVKIPKK